MYLLRSLLTSVPLCLWGVMHDSVTSADTESWSDFFSGSAISAKLSVALGYSE